MATRRKNPDSAGFYIALVAGGALLYLLLRKGTPEALPSDKPAIVGGGGGGGGRPTKGCHGLPFMPLDKGEQLQENLNAFFDRAGLAQCKVDGYFGNNTARLLDYYRSELAPMAERARRTPTKDSGVYTVLADASIFYDPIASDTVTFDLYQKGCDLPAFSMRKSLYDKLTSPSFAWSANDLSAAGLTPAVAG
jgi:hypothetical protein